MPEEQKKLLLHIGFDIAVSLLDITFLAILVWMVGLYTQTHPAHTFLSDLISKSNIPAIIGLFTLLYAAKNLLACYVLRQQQLFSYQVATRMSQDQLTHYFQSGFNEYVQTDSSVHIRRISQQPVEFCHYVLHGLQQVIGQLILVLITISAIVFFDAQLFAILLLILLPPVALIAFFIKKHMSLLRYQTKTASEKSLQHLNEALAGYVESHIYDKKDFFTKRYIQWQQKLNEHLANQQTLQSLPSRIIEVVAILGLVVLMMLQKSVNGITISTLTIGAFMAAAYKIIPGIVKILNGIGQIKAYQFTIADLWPAQKQTKQNKSHTTDGIQSVEFKNVSFTYHHKPILTDFNLHLTTGDFVGISGVSGRGKTTIVNLLLGFLHPDSGEIIINNNITNDLQRQAYHHRISYVRQQSFFMYDTLLNNIIFEDNHYNEKRLNEVVDAVGVHMVLNGHTKMNSKMINEHGKNISGGQRQRVALARALYKDFDLLILDEPCSELDELSEVALLKNLQSLANKGKMIVLITHRPHSLSFCTKTVCMNE